VINPVRRTVDRHNVDLETALGHQLPDIGVGQAAPAANELGQRDG
jgi:hypothetical protein